jgi:hypothetical protein
MVAADMCVAVAFNDDHFLKYYKPVDISFDPISKYTQVIPNSFSGIFCMYDLPWTRLKTSLLSILNSMSTTKEEKTSADTKQYILFVINSVGKECITRTLKNITIDSFNVFKRVRPRLRYLYVSFF